MNRGKESRLEVQARMSPLRHHSMNQIKGNAGYQGEERVKVDRRVLRKQKKLDRKLEEAQVSVLPFSADIFTEAVSTVRDGIAPSFFNAYLKTHLGQFEEAY